jgi:hypothetical protein
MKPFNNSFATLKLREEQSSFDEQNVTGADGAYNASLHASKKKRNPFTEDELSGYKKLKGFRPGHTKDTGGFQYSDLWGVNEGFEVGDKAKVTMKGNVNHNKIGEIVDVTEDGKYFTLQFKNNTKSIYHQSDITIPAGIKDFEEKPRLDIDEAEQTYNDDDIYEPYEQDDDEDDYDWFTDTYEKSTKNENHSDSNAQELERVENLLSVAHQKNDYSVMSAYENRIKRLKLLVAIEKKIGKQLPRLEFHVDFANYLRKELGYKGPIKYSQLGGLKNAVEIADFIISSQSQINENYHRFKKETVTRSKEQQMHEAMKLVRKKLYEAEKVIDYVKTMKEELGLQEYKSHTNKLMEKLQISISEIYKKYKSIK